MYDFLLLFIKYTIKLNNILNKTYHGIIIMKKILIKPFW